MAKQVFVPSAGRRRFLHFRSYRKSSINNRLHALCSIGERSRNSVTIVKSIAYELLQPIQGRLFPKARPVTLRSKHHSLVQICPLESYTYALPFCNSFSLISIRTTPGG